MSVGLSCGHLTSGVCLRCENVSLRAQAQKAVAEVERLREALKSLLSEAECSEADSENDHAGCVQNAGAKISRILSKEKS